MIQRFLPNFAEAEITRRDLKKYASPLKPGTVLTKTDCSKDKDEVYELETEYGFRFIEVIGSMNWLAYTCYEEIYAIRKLCRFMALPGRPHFQAALHLLHHFRCHPPKPLIYYSDIEEAPVIKMLKDVPEFQKYDPTFFVFADSSHGDSDERKSTACDLQVYQGGLIDHISWIPNPIPMSSAESENNCYSAAIMRMKYTKKALMKLLNRSEESQLTVPILVDSTAAIAMNTSDNPSRNTRHVESRFWYAKSAVKEGHAAFVKVEGSTKQPADPGTKIQADTQTAFYRSLFESNKHLL